jgi:hypothetical protein
MNTKRTELVLRAGVVALALEAGMIGVHALFFPLYFYNKFLLGRGWVKMLPPYNEHITRDLGALYLGFFVVLAYAAVKLSKDVFNAAVLGFVVATVPHMIFHAAHAADAPMLIDKILQVGLLAVTVALGLGLLLIGGRNFSEPTTLAGSSPAPTIRKGSVR